ncbi:hypothetical protein [Acinetobacter equi]|uniref:Uncharacterized protein n=1 Tax=Acinetobacter equi TaxID=1324350 RepID=A0A0N9W202_9GAMM|nr:hypothetical protein [Acinetobacter equi]ALH95680.1 hypothetical protein AOY20_09130 [Acinetobacter equi]
MKIKLLMIVFLMFSGFMAYIFEAYSKGFVIYAPYGEYVYMKDIQGSISDGGMAIGSFGIICLIISSILIFIKNTKYILRIGFSVFLFFLLALMMIEGDSIDQLIINTIKYDHNIYLILWCISLTLYTFLLTIFYIKNK